MIRVLNGADFSGCNIGTADFPIPETTEAARVAALFPSATENQKNKIKQLINSLIFYGIYGSLTYLALPYVANDESLAVQNVLLTSGNQPILSQGDATLDAGNGIKFSTGSGIKIDNSHYRAFSMDAGKYSFGCCIVWPGYDEYGDFPIVTTLLKRFTSQSSNRGRMVISGTKANPLLKCYIGTFSANNPQGTLNGTNNKAIQIASCDNTNGNDTAIALNGINNVATGDASECVDTENCTYFGSYGSDGFLGYYRLVFEGEPLSVAQVQTFRDLMMSFCDYSDTVNA